MHLSDGHSIPALCTARTQLPTNSQFSNDDEVSSQLKSFMELHDVRRLSSNLPQDLHFTVNGRSLSALHADILGSHFHATLFVQTLLNYTEPSPTELLRDYIIGIAERAPSNKRGYVGGT